MTLRTQEQDIMGVMIFHDQWKISPVVVRDNVLSHVALIASTNHTYVIFEIQIVGIFCTRPSRGFKLQLDCIGIKACQFAFGNKTLFYI